MKVERLSASAISTLNQCEHQFFLQYVLDIKSPAGPSALVGNIVHSCMESLALSTLHNQWDDKILGTLTKADIDPELLTDRFFDQYVLITPEVTLTNADRKKCHRLVNKALTFENNRFDPRNCDVVGVEKWFDLEIAGEWGEVKLRGFIDLVIREDEKTLRVIDYKTGSDWDFFKKKKKDYDYLNQDHQLRFYHWAGHKLFPEIEDILVEIYFIDKDVSYLFPFGKENAYKAELYIDRKMKKLEKINVPRPNITNNCKFCYFSKNNWGDTAQSMCDFFQERVIIDGLEETTNKYKVVKDGTKK